MQNVGLFIIGAGAVVKSSGRRRPANITSPNIPITAPAPMMNRPTFCMVLRKSLRLLL